MMEFIGRELKEGLSYEQAILKIQSMWKIRRARKYLKHMISNVYTRHLDEKSGHYYYYNSKTKEVKWTKPQCLGSSTLEDIRKERKGRNQPLTPETAARMIQGMYRTRSARLHIRELIQSLYKKHFDPNTGNYFYIK